MNKREPFFHNLRKMDEGGSSLLLLLLLSTDYLFMILHVMNRITPFNTPLLFRVDIDGSYSEFYQYIKFFWLIILFAYLLLSTQYKGYVSWLLIFVYFLLDDALQIHERLGLVVGQSIDLNLPFALRVRDVGELVVFGLFGMLLMIILGWAYFRGPQIFRKVSNDLLILLGAFVSFAVIFDLLLAAVDLGQTTNAIIALLEDGGEMLVTSLFLWYVFLLCLWKGKPTAYLHECFRRSDDINPPVADSGG